MNNLAVKGLRHTALYALITFMSYLFNIYLFVHLFIFYFIYLCNLFKVYFLSFYNIYIYNIESYFSSTTNPYNNVAHTVLTCLMELHQSIKKMC